jgi:hypothetical protein
MKGTLSKSGRWATWKRRIASTAWLAGACLGVLAAGPASVALGQSGGFSFSAPGDGPGDYSAPVRRRSSAVYSSETPVRFSGFLQDPEALPPPATDPFADDPPGTVGPASAPGTPPQLGEAPREPDPQETLQFLRDQSVLLEMGEHQFEVALQYQFDEQDTVLAQFVNGNLQIGEAKIRQRLLLMPLEFRYGWSPVTQLFINMPFGWSNGEISFAGQDEFSNVGGPGDLAAGFTRQCVDGDEHIPDVLFTFAFSAPTGNVDFAQSLATPGTGLGQGFWSLSAYLTCIKRYDPIVVFYGIGYQHRFERPFDLPGTKDSVHVNPGSVAVYRFGLGFAVNPRVTLSASFVGQYISEAEVNGRRVAGDIREPMNLRLAATIVRDRKHGKHGNHGKIDLPADVAAGKTRVQTIEPYVNFGLNESSIDAILGIACTY